MTRQEIQNEIEALLRSTGRQDIEHVIDYMRTSDFYDRPCHSHHRFDGGLAQHSLETCRFALSRCGDLPRGSVIVASLLHDLCTSHSAAARGIRGHGRRSVGILGRVCRFHLDRAEYEAIKLHMHRNAKEMATNPLARLVWKADKVSAARLVHLGKSRILSIFAQGA